MPADIYTRPRFRLIAAVIAAASAGIALSTAANGQDGLPPQGAFALTFSTVDADGGAAVAIGPDRIALAVNQTAHLFNDEGAGFLHYATGSCAGFQIVDLAANTIEVTGYCNYRDADGDRIFEAFATDGAVAIDAVTMTSEWTGGTGKYTDISGTFVTEAFVSLQDGRATLIGGRKTGEYEIAGAVAQEPAAPEPAAPAPAAPEPAAPEPAAPAAPAAPAEEDPALLAALIDEGESVFRRNCTGCHGAEGGGGEGPAFVNSARLASVSTILTQIIQGGAYMPAFDALSDRQVAAVGTFIRNSFGNSFGILTEERVAAFR